MWVKGNITENDYSAAGMRRCFKQLVLPEFPTWYVSGLVGAGDRDLDHFGTAACTDGTNLFCRHFRFHSFGFDAQ